MPIRTRLPRSLLLLSAPLALSLAGCADDIPAVPGTGTGSGTAGTDTTGTPPDSTGNVDTTMSADSTGPAAVCGDGMVEGDEACDDANPDDGDGCSAACTVEDGFSCDDADPSTCTAVCGDGLVLADEACDDANPDDGDGCSATCTVEDGFDCDDADPTVCTGICGDGLIVGAEECDDANDVPDDGCDGSTCTVETGWACGGEPSLCTEGCGDGLVVGMETCDDGARIDGDGCSAICQIEPGWLCMDEPTVCTSDCGDGIIVGTEICDDSNTMAGDGCDDLCGVETGWYCTGAPSLCETQCGDGLVAGAEACDDINIAQGDGCSFDCSLEFGWTCVGDPSTCTLTETATQIALGGFGGCILSTLGNVACFGDNTEGEVGNGTDEVETFLPAFALANATAIHAGDEHHCAIVVGGDLYCWGDNAQTQMGPASLPPADELTPIQVTGLPPVADMDAGFDHNCVLDGVGQVWCWGDNSDRQLGRGGTTTTDDPNPQVVPMPGGLSAIDLGLGENHSCAVLSDTTVACWGDDDNGQLGDGLAGTDSGNAALVVGGLSGIADVEGGRDTTCARSNLGDVWCWGESADGQVGNGSTADAPTPQPIALPAPADDISLGTEYSCALLSTEEIYCWGESDDFQTGVGDLFDVLTPAAVMGLPAGVDFIDLEAGARHICAMTATGERWCWGRTEEGQLGLAPLNQLDLSPPLSFSGPLASLVTSPFEYRGVLCGVLTDGTVECVGDGTLTIASPTLGAMGFFEPITYHLEHLTALPLLSDVQQLTVGDGHICAATSTEVLCWGDNLNRNLGQGGTSTVDSEFPLPVMNIGAVDEIDAGDQFVCARVGGLVSCWGDNDNYQTSEGTTTTDQSLPIQVPGLIDAVDVECGENHACALRASGVVSCWGDDGASQLGDDDLDPADSANPVDVTGLPGAADQIAIGHDHGCALVAGEVWCWGDAFYGQLGQGNDLDSDTALMVPGLGTIVQIVAGGNYTCALDDMGEVSCWGYGQDGHFGNGGEEITLISDFLSPVPFEVASGVTDIVASNSYTCVETVAGWQCVGFRGPGHLAYGTLEPALPSPNVFGP